MVIVALVAVEINLLGPPRVTRDGEPVMAREGSVLVATFHPELTDDPTVHRYFCAMVAETRDSNHHGRQE